MTTPSDTEIAEAIVGIISKRQISDELIADIEIACRRVRADIGPVIRKRGGQRTRVKAHNPLPNAIIQMLMSVGGPNDPGTKQNGGGLQRGGSMVINATPAPASSAPQTATGVGYDTTVLSYADTHSTYYSYLHGDQQKYYALPEMRSYFQGKQVLMDSSISGARQSRLRGRVVIVNKVQRKRAQVQYYGSVYSIPLQWLIDAFQKGYFQ